MGLKMANAIKTVIGAADLSLRADVGESFLIKYIGVLAASDVYVTLRIEKTTVGFFRVGPTFGNHLPLPRAFTADGTSFAGLIPVPLLTYLYEKGIFKGYPVAEGETFHLTGATGGADVKTVIYDIYDPEDQTSDSPNGSKAKEYFFINYGDTTTAITTPGDHLYNRSRNPAEFPLFPFGVDVPAKTNILLHGICGKEVGVRNATPATAIFTRYLKLIKEREVLFDEDRNGLLFDFSNVTGAAGTRVAGGSSVIGDLSTVDPRYPLIFPQPLVFESGEELLVYVSTIEPVDGSSIPVDWTVIGLIETVIKVT